MEANADAGPEMAVLAALRARNWSSSPACALARAHEALLAEAKRKFQKPVLANEREARSSWEYRVRKIHALL